MLHGRFLILDFFVLFFALQTDFLFYLQLDIVAYQDGNPKVFTKSKLTVNVARNPNPPVWTLPAYTKTINENQPPFSMILKVTATDKDRKVSQKKGKF